MRQLRCAFTLHLKMLEKTYGGKSKAIPLGAKAPSFLA
jgi:hypothetical protein